MKATPAPIALFAYNRPEHLQQCLDALSKADLAQRSDVFIFIDGPKNSSGIEAAAAVHRVALSSKDKFRSLTITKRDENLGLAANIIDGVTLLTGQHGKVIVIEDDLVVASGFLKYMNWSLEFFEGDPRVGSVHGYCYPGFKEQSALFFMKGGDCWGWGTWKDRWDLFQPDGRRLLKKLLVERKLAEFTLGFAAPYCRMLCRQILGLNNSWAVRWHASLFLADRLTLYPSSSLVQNIGLDGSGTHCAATNIYDTVANDFLTDISSRLTPIPVASKNAYKHFQSVFSGGRKGLRMWLYRVSSLTFDVWWILRVQVRK